MGKLNLIATAAFGVEAIVGRELKRLGFEDQYIENGKVNFSGDESAIAKTNLWLRTADRVLLKVGEFKALTFDQLFEGTKALPWDEFIPENSEFPVEGKSIDSKLFSVPDCQAIVKKAVVEKLKKRCKKDWLDETGPLYKIQVAILKDMVTLTIDTTGPGLHKRGYRKLVGEAPLKETLACAMLMVSRWNWERVLLDPFCGTGTIPIEAAMIALNMAPGMNRNFVSEQWPWISQRHWDDAREEAKSLIKFDRELRIQGSDINEDVIKLARYHAKLAGVDTKIHVQKLPMSDIRSRFKYGFIVCNPPYGERIGEKDSVEKLYKEMKGVFSNLDTWSYYILTSHPDFERIFGRSADKKRKLYNGRLMCNYFQYFGPKPPRIIDDTVIKEHGYDGEQ